MIEYIIYVMMVLIDILLIEFIIITGKVIYDDFFKNEEEYVKIDKELWEKIKEQTRKYNK